jgi:hypothetical protein
MDPRMVKVAKGGWDKNCFQAFGTVSQNHESIARAIANARLRASIL